jgi:hypothetical protein
MRAVAAASAALCAAGCAYSYRTDGTGTVVHRASPLMLWSQPAPSASAMAPGRTISEQDCAAPIVNAAANLRCR